MAQFLYFSTGWCGPCKAFKPVVQAAAAETGANISFIDAEHQPALAAQYGITSVPAIVIVDGQNTVKLVGPQPKAKLLQIFSQN